VWKTALFTPHHMGGYCRAPPQPSPRLTQKGPPKWPYFFPHKRLSLDSGRKSLPDSHYSKPQWVLVQKPKNSGPEDPGSLTTHIIHSNFHLARHTASSTWLPAHGLVSFTGPTASHLLRQCDLNATTGKLFSGTVRRKPVRLATISDK
jgi:hypothetical protein